MQPKVAKKRVFISYAREDQNFAKKLYDDLKRAGVTPWLDSEDLRPGQNWKVTIRQTIRNSSYVLALLSSRALSKRGFVHKELRIALEILDELPENEVFLIPVRLDECEPGNEQLQDLHRVDLFPSYEAGLEKILHVLAPDSNTKMIQVPVNDHLQNLSKQERTIQQFRTNLLQILYTARARTPSDALNSEELAERMKTSWDKIRHEITYLTDKKYIKLKERQMRTRIYRWIYLTAEGIDFVEREMDIKQTPEKQALSSIPFKLQLHLRDGMNFDVRGLETPMGEPYVLSQLPYSPDELVVVLKALRMPKYDADRFSSEQCNILEQLGLLRESRFVPDLHKQVGQALYDALISGDVNIAFQMALNQARTDRNTVALQLRFGEDAVELVQYPWELLYHRRPLLPSRAVELTRYISYPEAVTALPVKPPLRLLYIESRPTDLSSLPNEHEQKTAREALKALEEENHLSIDLLPQPTYPTLLDHLEKDVVHVLHFDGHGVFARQCPECSMMNYPRQIQCANCNQEIDYIEPQGYLAFEKEDQTVHWISSELLGTLLYSRPLRLVVLSACWSSSVGGETLFGGTAPALIQAGIPAVVSTQLPISVNAAVDFMQGFYSALSRFESVSAAVNAGRIRIFTTQEWFIPTLYLRSKDDQGNLFSQQ